MSGIWPLDCCKSGEAGGKVEDSKLQKAQESIIQFVAGAKFVINRAFRVLIGCERTVSRSSSVHRLQRPLRALKPSFAGANED